MKPNLIIAGTNKSGTTALFRYLAAHPDVCASAVKETCYFLPLRYEKPIDPIETYERHFAQYASERLVLESTPGYYYGGVAVANEIARTLPEVRVVLVFRDPVTRFFSFFNFMKWMQKIDGEMTASAYLDSCLALSPHDFLDEDLAPFFGFEGGQYARYLDPWVETFGDRLRITFFENLTQVPRDYLRNLAAFAEIDPAPFDTMAFTQENRTRGFANAKLHAMALKAYGASGPILNRSPAVKRLVRSVYNAINETAIYRQPSDEAATAEILKGLYAEAKRDFRDRLFTLPESLVIGPVPSW